MKRQRSPSPSTRQSCDTIGKQTATTLSGATDYTLETNSNTDSLTKIKTRRHWHPPECIFRGKDNYNKGKKCHCRARSFREGNQGDDKKKDKEGIHLNRHCLALSPSLRKTPRSQFYMDRPVGPSLTKEEAGGRGGLLRRQLCVWAEHTQRSQGESRRASSQKQ